VKYPKAPKKFMCRAFCHIYLLNKFGHYSIYPMVTWCIRGDVICTTVICTNAKKMEKTGLCTTTFRGDVISTNTYGDKQRNKYYQKCIHWIMYYQLPRTGLCTTYGWVKVWLELAPQSVIMPSARISLTQVEPLLG
jgi:hypothetical protein